MIRWTISWMAKGQTPACFQIPMLKLSTGNTLTHSLTHTYTLTHTLTHTFSHSHSHIHTLIHTHTYSDSLSFTHTIQIKCILTILSFFIPFHSKPLKPSTQSNKNLPFIKVIEIKSWSRLWQRWNVLITRIRMQQVIRRLLRTYSSTTACNATQRLMLRTTATWCSCYQTYRLHKSTDAARHGTHRQICT